ncbi:helix-turn-helix domain protein [Moorella thermoacetica]|nr:helix-turn-helix domain protein [Moorella thermoacetica]AKX97607.1 helix-turn-helix domain protein [Moorella thermoacetica]OIQ54265.1 helix-turn-helix domain protein [Moorella thermoacetica]OIQ54866.1 helix-turn-helix domain protein [Moorella thermoacetica]QDA01433.1 Helix-turn-helix domain protein [Moorella thermoacetica]
MALHGRGVGGPSRGLVRGPGTGLAFLLAGGVCPGLRGELGRAGAGAAPGAEAPGTVNKALRQGTYLRSERNFHSYSQGGCTLAAGGTWARENFFPCLFIFLEGEGKPQKTASISRAFEVFQRFSHFWLFYGPSGSQTATRKGFFYDKTFRASEVKAYMDEELKNLPVFLTVEEAAKTLRLKRSTAYEYVQQGFIPSIRLGHFIRVPKARILEMAGLLETENRRKEKGQGAANL